MRPPVSAINRQALWTNGHRRNKMTASLSDSGHHDPFDTEWAALATRANESNLPNLPKSTNPFIQNTNSVKAFEVQL
jgi:hypothetical protein